MADDAREIHEHGFRWLGNSQIGSAGGVAQDIGSVTVGEVTRGKRCGEPVLDFRLIFFINWLRS